MPRLIQRQLPSVLEAPLDTMNHLAKALGLAQKRLIDRRFHDQLIAVSGQRQQGK